MAVRRPRLLQQAHELTDASSAFAVNGVFPGLKAAQVLPGRNYPSEPILNHTGRNLPGMTGDPPAIRF
jgi:hypothetical protein